MNAGPWCCWLGLTTYQDLYFHKMGKATIYFATWNTKHCPVIFHKFYWVKFRTIEEFFLQKLSLIVTQQLYKWVLMTHWTEIGFSIGIQRVWYPGVKETAHDSSWRWQLQRLYRTDSIPSHVPPYTGALAVALVLVVESVLQQADVTISQPTGWAYCSPKLSSSVSDYSWYEYCCPLGLMINISM